VLILKIINLYISRLEKQADRFQKVKSIKAELWKEREDQLEAIRDDTGRLSKALDEVVAAGVLQAYESLAIRVTKLNEGLDVIFNGEKLNID
jgi:hypothetical protein